jgi:hypothetical protein
VRAAERETQAGALPVRNAQEIDGSALWVAMIAVSMLLSVVCLSSAGEWSPPRIVACSVLACLCACLLLCIVSQRRFWWAPRIIAGMLGFSCLAAVYLAAWYMPTLAHDPRLPAVFMATVCFLVAGVPALCFMLWGHTHGKLARLDAGRITRMDVWTGRLLVLLRYALFIAVAFYVLRLLYLGMAL